MEFKVVCIDDSCRPNDIPTSKWIERNEVYTVIQADFLNAQNGVLGFKLKEKNLDNCFPYQYFAARIFRPLTRLDLEAEKAVKQLLEEQYAKVQ